MCPVFPILNLYCSKYRAWVTCGYFVTLTFNLWRIWSARVIGHFENYGAMFCLARGKSKLFFVFFFSGVLVFVCRRNFKGFSVFRKRSEQTLKNFIKSVVRWLTSSSVAHFGEDAGDSRSGSEHKQIFNFQEGSNIKYPDLTKKRWRFLSKTMITLKFSEIGSEK